MRDRERGNKRESAKDKEIEKLKEKRESLIIVVKHKDEGSVLLKSQSMPLQPKSIPGNSL